eukprot:CAMPEP_0119369974 /NCGR_PEP_ID=MMETSP1334-20130426/16411_1 /TAXON_ID=127549 /ORGANISM="Calcidiscus leptoporus, Strain RCC1130" /LENGTH=186 /DNA_ID=CAMNT_0007386929 /DNA_START=754 /DNA_END=1313 /DNA_ORIENTATION=-
MSTKKLRHRAALMRFGQLWLSASRAGISGTHAAHALAGQAGVVRCTCQFLVLLQGSLGATRSPAGSRKSTLATRRQGGAAATRCQRGTASACRPSGTAVAQDQNRLQTSIRTTATLSRKPSMASAPKEVIQLGVVADGEAAAVRTARHREVGMSMLGVADDRIDASATGGDVSASACREVGMSMLG